MLGDKPLEVPRKAPPPGETLPGNRHFQYFDSLRAIAALSVVVCHVTLVSRGRPGVWSTPFGALGVDTFFVISGFLLYRPFVQARFDGRRPPRPRDFYRRRALRILPAYWFALTLLTIWPGLEEVTSSHWWVYYGFLQVYSYDWVGNGISPAWSLGVELSYYALLPLFAYAIGRVLVRRKGREAVRFELRWIAAFALVSLFSRWILRQTGLFEEVTLDLVNTTLVGQWFFFSLGMILAGASVLREGGSAMPRVAYLAERPTAVWAAAGGAFAVLLGIWVIGLQDSRFVSHVEILVAIAATLLVFPAVFELRTPGLPHRVLGNPLLLWLGLVSYGIYLWHRPIVDHLKADVLSGNGEVVSALVLFVTVPLLAAACAAVSYYLVERPALRWKDRIDQRLRLRPAPRLDVEPGTAEEATPAG